MARYIDVDKLIMHLKDLIEECENPNVDTQPIAYGTVLGIKGALSYAETLPTADVVEVVKCENCVYFDINIPYHEEYGTCEKHDFNIFQKSFYCGYAERTPQKEG